MVQVWSRSFLHIFRDLESVVKQCKLDVSSVPAEDLQVVCLVTLAQIV